MPGPRSVIVISGGAYLNICLDLILSDGGPAEGTRQLRVLGPGSELYQKHHYTFDNGWLEYSADILEGGSMTYDENGALGFVTPSGVTMFAVFGENPLGVLSPPAVIPEPAALTLLTLGGLALLRRRT